MFNIEVTVIGESRKTLSERYSTFKECWEAAQSVKGDIVQIATGVGEGRIAVDGECPKYFHIEVCTRSEVVTVPRTFRTFEQCWKASVKLRKNHPNGIPRVVPGMPNTDSVMQYGYISL